MNVRQHVSETTREWLISYKDKASSSVVAHSQLPRTAKRFSSRSQKRKKNLKSDEEKNLFLHRKAKSEKEKKNFTYQMEYKHWRKRVSRSRLTGTRCCFILTSFPLSFSCLHTDARHPEPRYCGALSLLSGRPIPTAIFYSPFGWR